MEYIDGMDLSRLTRLTGPFSIAKACSLMHSVDFGLAQISLWDEASAELTTVGQLMGTNDYMAPEQAERADSVDYRADWYSLLYPMDVIFEIKSSRLIGFVA